MIRNKIYGHNDKAWVCSVEFVVLLGFFAFCQSAVAQVACEQELEQAQTAYLNAEPDTALDLISRCLERTDLTEANRVRAFELQAHTHLSMGNLGQARESVLEILVIQPEYQPDPRERPEYLNLVDEIKQEREIAAIPPFPLESPAFVPVPAELESPAFDLDVSGSSPGQPSGKPWLWIGLGAVTVGGGVLGFVVSRPGNGIGPEEPLPDPPDDPILN